MSLENDCPICLGPLTTDGTANNRPVNVHAAPLPLNQPIPTGYYDEDGAKHFFHENCIGNWTQNSLCPMCNQHMIIRGPAPQQMIVDDDSEEEDGFLELACDGCPIVMATNDVRTSNDWRDVEGYGHLQSNGNYCNNCVENWICPACNEIINHEYRYRPSGTFREQCPWCEVGQTYAQWAPENEPNWSSSGEDSDVEHIDFLSDNDSGDEWICIYCGEPITTQEITNGEYVDVPNDTGGTNTAHEVCAGDHASDFEDEYDDYEQTMDSIAQHTEIGGGKRRKKNTRKKRGGSGSESKNKKQKTDWRARLQKAAENIGDEKEKLKEKIKIVRTSPIIFQDKPLTKTAAAFEDAINKLTPLKTKDSTGGRRKKKKRKKTKKKALRRRRKKRATR